MSCGLIDSLLPSMDSILGVRDQIGAALKPVWFVTRTWYTDDTLATESTALGQGSAQDQETQLLPSPRIREFSQDLRLVEGGMVKRGDLILSGISKQTYREKDLDGSSCAGNIETLFKVGDKLYQVISVRERLVTFDVHVRELTNQARY